MNRKELKEKGKNAFKKNYWRCVLVAFIVSVIIGSTLQSGRSSSSSSQTSYELTNNPNLLAWLAGISVVVFVIAFVIRLLILRPLYVGCQNFFLVNTKQEAEFSELGLGFKRNYKNTVLTMFLMHLFQFLWTLLLIVPGIIKHYSYRMVPYILAENPDLPAREIIDQSRQMMDGHKWEAFVLDLSFILWWLLGTMTCGIAGIFWCAPYVFQTNAEYYLSLK